MNPKEYEQNVLITESCDFEAIKGRVDDRMIRLLHAGLGMSSELAELETAIHKDPIDLVNVSEEAGDLFWYVSIAINTLGFNPTDISKHETSELGCARLADAIDSVVWCTGEFNDLLKKHLFYGRELNLIKMENVLSQICVAISGICAACDKTPAQVREVNIAKLKARFKDKFTEVAALNRDLATERKILEGQ
jgi:hypothetical protein